MPALKKIGFVSDPLENYDRKAEMTLFLMHEAAKRHIEIFQWEISDLIFEDENVLAKAKKLEMTSDPQNFYKILDEKKINVTDLDSLFLRKDPPFDLAYLHHLYLLAKAEDQILMINRPTGLMVGNEKMIAFDFPFYPPTVVTNNRESLKETVRKNKKGSVLKPLHEAGGRDIFRVGPETKNLEEILKKVSNNFRHPIICQHYIKEVEKEGDKRILLFNGKIIGAFSRFPKEGEFRANLHQGGHFTHVELTEQDRKIVDACIPQLQKMGLYLAGLDLIGPYLTEINVTSPMGTREINETSSIVSEKIIFEELLNFKF